MPLNPQTPRPTNLATSVTVACLLEVAAPKPGNVYPGADFEDVTFADFAISAAVVGPILAKAEINGVGSTVLGAVEATIAAVGTNTNLGMVLIIAPLAAVPEGKSLGNGIAAVLEGLTAVDTRHVYEAIRIARPGGLGTVGTADIADHAPPQASLCDVMELAADRDMIARQYGNGFHEVIEHAAPWIAEGLSQNWYLSDAIVWAHLQLMARFPDSLIARKCGPEMAGEAASRAAAVLQLGQPGDAAYEQAISELDFWLRADGHRRNPGTTADLIAAGLFVLLREGQLAWPIRFYR